MRKNFFISIFSSLYKKYLVSIVNKNSEENSIHLIVENDFFVHAVDGLKNFSLFQFKMLNDICAIDHLDKLKRFELSYNFLSLNYNFRLIVKTYTNNYANSLMPYYKSACWIEREIWDMFGILFTNHSDLRRILTDYGFNGFPLRKDFPLTGYVEIRYDDEIANIIYEPLEMSQEYRLFNFNSPWEKIK